MEPVLERIAVEIRHRLALIPFVESVIRPRRIETETIGDRKITLTQGTSTPNSNLSCPGNPPAVAFDQIFRIAGELRPSELDETPIETIKNRFDAQVRLALTAASDWYTFGGNAVNANVGSAVIMRADETAAVMIEMLVMYRHNEDDATVER